VSAENLVVVVGKNDFPKQLLFQDDIGQEEKNKSDREQAG
jgi:hypothetical protein